MLVAGVVMGLPAGLLGVGRGLVIVSVFHQFLAAMEINVNPRM